MILSGITRMFSPPRRVFVFAVLLALLGPATTFYYMPPSSLLFGGFS